MLKHSFSCALERLLHLPQFFRFCVVGAIGFAIDAGILSALFWGFGLSPFIARVPAFICAVFATWLLNSLLTFKLKKRPPLVHFFGYLCSNVLGLSLNFGVYSACIHLSEWMAQFPVSALAVASIAALFFNYMAAKKVIFKAKS